MTAYGDTYRLSAAEFPTSAVAPTPLNGTDNDTPSSEPTRVSLDLDKPGPPPDTCVHRFRQRLGFQFLSVDSFWGPLRRLVKYDPRKLNWWFAWMPPVYRHGTIFDSCHTLQTVVLALWCISIPFWFDADNQTAALWTDTMSRFRKNGETVRAPMLPALPPPSIPDCVV